MNGSNRFYCIACIRPHVTQYCNGNTGTHYEQCALHSNFARIIDDATIYPEKVRDILETALIFVNTDCYETIRQHIGRERMALQLCKHSHWDVEITLYLSKEQGSLGYTARETITRAMNTMLKPLKKHAAGCLHSNKPEMIVCKIEGQEHENRNRETAVKEPSLVSGLYFKRCVGLFKNTKGEVLALHS